MYANGCLLKTSDPPNILDYTLETKFCYVSARSQFLLYFTFFTQFFPSMRKVVTFLHLKIYINSLLILLLA